MKKMLFVIALGAFAACGTGKTEEKKADTTAVSTVDTAAKKVDTAAAKLDTAAKKVDTAAVKK